MSSLEAEDQSEVQPAPENSVRERAGEKALHLRGGDGRRRRAGRPEREAEGRLERLIDARSGGRRRRGKIVRSGGVAELIPPKTYPSPEVALAEEISSCSAVCPMRLQLRAGVGARRPAARFWTVVWALELIEVSAFCAVERLVETRLLPAVSA